MPAPETPIMSIATRPTGPDLASGSWDAGEPRIDSSQPPKVLLPDGGDPVPALAPAPETALARDALSLIRAARPGGPPGSTWLDVAMSPDVDAVRDQLRPIRSRRTLAASYGREAFHRIDPGGAATVRLAYALRWAELGPDRA